MFAGISGKYDFMNTVMTGGAHKRWRRSTARAAAGGLLPGVALDVATGTGDMAFELARQPEVSAVTGVDFVPEMLLLAQKKQQKRKLKKPIDWVLGDALSLPFPDGAFICATAGFGIRNMTDLRLAISEMARVVRPGGRVAILELTRPGKKRSIGSLPAKCFSYLAPLLGQLLAKDRQAYAYLPRSVEKFPAAPELARLMTDIGLKNVRWRLLGIGLVALHTGEVQQSLRQN